MQVSMARGAGHKPLYFVNTSSGVQASDPNSMRDMGRARNAVYDFDDPTTEQVARTVTWHDIVKHDQELGQMASQAAAS